MSTLTITVNGQTVLYTLESEIADAQQTSEFKDRAGRRIGLVGYAGYAVDVVIYASSRTIANMIYRRHFAE